MSVFFGRRVIVLEAGLAPSSSPAQVLFLAFLQFFDSLKNGVTIAVTPFSYLSRR